MLECEVFVIIIVASVVYLKCKVFLPYVKDNIKLNKVMLRLQ